MTGPIGIEPFVGPYPSGGPVGSLLLDQYPGASAAFSLRLLRTGHTLPAVRIRRSSDNTERDFAFIDGVVDELSAEDFCAGTNGFVSAWYDQSGNDQHATQATASKQPQIISGGSMIGFSGKKGIIFSASSLISSVQFNPQSATAFTAWQLAVANDRHCVFAANQSSPFNNFVCMAFSNEVAVWKGGTLGAGGTATTSPRIRTYVFSASNAKAYANSVLRGTATDADGTTNSIDIGGATANYGVLNGTVGEIVIYPTDSTSRATIDANLAAHFGIAL